MAEQKKLNDKTEEAAAKRELSEEELDRVSGSYSSELPQFVDLLNRYGYNKQAARLKKAGSINFSRTLIDILNEVGFPEKVEYLFSYEQMNAASIKGRVVSSHTLLEHMEDFFIKGDDYIGFI